MSDSKQFYRESTSKTVNTFRNKTSPSNNEKEQNNESFSNNNLTSFFSIGNNSSVSNMSTNSSVKTNQEEFSEEHKQKIESSSTNYTRSNNATSIDNRAADSSQQSHTTIARAKLMLNRLSSSTRERVGASHSAARAGEETGPYFRDDEDNYDDLTPNKYFYIKKNKKDDSQNDSESCETNSIDRSGGSMSIASTQSSSFRRGQLQFQNSYVLSEYYDSMNNSVDNTHAENMNLPMNDDSINSTGSSLLRILTGRTARQRRNQEEDGSMASDGSSLYRGAVAAAASQFGKTTKRVSIVDEHHVHVLGHSLEEQSESTNTKITNNTSASNSANAVRQSIQSGAKNVVLKSILRNRNSDNNSTHSQTRSSSKSATYSLNGAMRNFDKLQGWNEVVAAAAVVASSSTATNRRIVHYSVGDKCLVYVTILNTTLPPLKSGEDRKPPTKNPVNKFGYPRGLGYEIEEQRGPYSYVLCTVKSVHFDEDARYYTVTRMDMGVDQRSEPDWMEPILSEEGKSAALKATWTDRSTSTTQSDAQLRKRKHPCIEKCIGLCRFFKYQATLYLIGNIPYSVRFQFSSVNFLVLCSLLFNFLDQIRLVIPTTTYDRIFAYVIVIVWAILVVEFGSSRLIRPHDYSSIILSKDEFDPHIARYIDKFHVFVETFSLVCFIPELYGIFAQKWDMAYKGSLMYSSMLFAFIPDSPGILTYAAIRLRVVCVMRHWRNMFLNKKYNINENISEAARNKKKESFDQSLNISYSSKHESDKTDDIQIADETKLKNAAHIGTALMVVKCHRALVLVIFVYATTPLFNPTKNFETRELTQLLQGSNLAFSGNDTDSCNLLKQSTESWLRSVYRDNHPINFKISDHFLLKAQILPIRCEFQLATQGVITKEYCPGNYENYTHQPCSTWSLFNVNSTEQSMANAINNRVGSLKTYVITDNIYGQDYQVTATYSQQKTISEVNFFSILIQCTLVFLILIGLTSSFNLINQLILYPLHRMLRIVLRYSKNPLAPAPKKKESKKRSSKFMKRDLVSSNASVTSSEDFGIDELFDSGKGVIGSLETEQLIGTISKITDLLRKCWGVAGANIISSNLARQQSGRTVTFNPTVPGKAVYALFGFAAINDFSSHMRSLEQDIMILINDVASVVHDEVFRWGYGTSGQCNKNLGSCFLLVFRIGEFNEVRENKMKASKVIFANKFKNNRKKKVPVKRKIVNKWSETVVLSSLPGIGGFTDRALIGMLKSFAGINRSERLRSWKNDLRLGAGVGAFSVGMIFGMDAGWAVEGAVGSEFKVDATYLSPHVNMASRMMSACKQFGVTILLSQAIEELFTDECRRKLRHLDTVTVKGSSIKQKIFTYDARELGVNFFLYGHTEDEADIESELYEPSIWSTDQDLTSMRQHISEEFMQEFYAGRDLYLAGKWPEAIEKLKKADEIMIETVMSGGYLAYDAEEFEMQLSSDEKEEIRDSIGDGPSRCLISYMERRGGIAPSSWQGFRPLTSK